MVLTEQQQKTIDLLNPWFSEKTIDLGVNRSSYLKAISSITKNQKQILFLLGSRRVGKTMIIYQYIYQLIKENVLPQKILFLSLDNTNLQDLELFSYLAQSDFEYIFLDEVQYFPNWAQILKSLYDLPMNKSKIICSGSSSKLIEDNKAFLTGRSTSMIVSPLSFMEFKGFVTSQNLIHDYLNFGGYPEYVLERQPNYLNDLLRDVIEKDVLKLHNVKSSKYLFEICQILAKQIGFKSSSNKIAKVLGMDNKTVKNYIEYIHEVRLIERVNKYSNSLNEQLYAPKKYYFNDLGLRNSFVGFSDIGSLVENAVFLRLSKLYGVENIYYYADGKLNEIDFVVDLKKNNLLLVESKYNNLTESVINSLSTKFYKDIYEKEIIDRLVVTDGINDQYKQGSVPIKLINLQDFLENDLF